MCIRDSDKIDESEPPFAVNPVSAAPQIPDFLKHPKVADAPASVSYTHLDVYKRQAMKFGQEALAAFCQAQDEFVAEWEQANGPIVKKEYPCLLYTSRCV